MFVKRKMFEPERADGTVSFHLDSPPPFSPAEGCCGAEAFRKSSQREVEDTFTGIWDPWCAFMSFTVTYGYS